jgi:pimeloyl-ACP methyl ester carboxylesterase
MAAEMLTEEVLAVGDVAVRVESRGSGPRLIFLHGMVGPQWTRGLELLAERFTVVMPEHPGFWRTPRPVGLRTVHDLAVVYLDVLDSLGAADAPVVGHSFGGWLAAEIAVMSPLGRLVLVDALGCRIRGEQRLDIFMHPREELLDFVYSDRRVAPTQGDSLEDRRNLNALAHFGWNPYLCNVRLERELHRISSPTLVVWGEHDRIVPPTHAELFAERIGGARTIVLDSGHDPTVERPEQFAMHVADFLTETEE